MRTFVASVLSLISVGLAAQPLRLESLKSAGTENAILAVESGDDCAGGLIYDDGSFEDAYGFQSSTLTGSYVMRMDFPPGTNVLKAVCACWRRQIGTAHAFHVEVWAADGPGGGPGTLLHYSNEITANLTSSPKFVRYEIPGGLTIPSERVYVGAQWFPESPDRFVCADTNGPGGQPAYAGTSIISPPSTLVASAFTDYKALGIRAEAEEVSCAPTATAMCLNNNRFKVEGHWRASDGTEGDAKVVKLTSDTGYLWFFNSSNVETVVKVLDACGLNQRFWVFAGGLTNVQVTLTVTDTETDTVKTYTNPQGTAFLPIQDTTAFATCQ